MPRARAVAALLVTLVVGGSARAAETSRDPIAAEALFREGRDQAKRGDFAAACPKFAESLRLDPTPGALLNLADCEEHIGKTATAWLHYSQLAQQVPPGDDRLAVAREHIASLEQRLPRLTVSLAKDAPAGATVVRDGVSLGVGSLETPLPVDPGHHVVVASAAGFADRSFDVELRDGEARSLVVSPGPHRVERPVATTSGVTTFGWVLTGIGGASVAVGVVTGILVLGRKSTFDSHCVQKACDAQGLDAASSGKTLSAVSTVTVVAGAALVGAGLYLVLTAKDGTSTSLGATPVVGGGTAMLRGSF